MKKILGLITLLILIISTTYSQTPIKGQIIQFTVTGETDTAWMIHTDSGFLIKSTRPMWIQDSTESLEVAKIIDSADLLVKADTSGVVARSGGTFTGEVTGTNFKMDTLLLYNTDEGESMKMIGDNAGVFTFLNEYDVESNIKAGGYYSYNSGTAYGSLTGFSDRFLISSENAPKIKFQSDTAEFTKYFYSPYFWNDAEINSNILIGNPASNSYLKSGYENIIIGDYAGFNINTGSTSNLLIGISAGYSLTSGNANLLLGRSSGASMTTGDNNTFVGCNTGYNSTGSGNVFIGKSAGYNETGSNKLYVDNSSTATPLIYGEFDNDSLRVNGKASISGDADCSTMLETMKVYASAMLPLDSATVTTATLSDTYYFVKGNFVNIIGRGIDFTGDTLYINRPDVDSILIEYKHTSRITSSKSATLRTGFADNGDAISGTTKSSSFGAGSSQSITHVGTMWVKDNDAIKYVVSSSASANDITFQESALIIEEKYTSESYNK